MARFKIVNGVRLEMSAEEQSAFEAEEVNGEARKVAREEAIAQRETNRASAKAKLIAGEALTEDEANTVVI